MPPTSQTGLNDTSVADIGTLTLRNVRAAGQVLLLAEDAVRSGHVHIEGLQIDRADVRGRSRRPHGFGVEGLSLVKGVQVVLKAVGLSIKPGGEVGSIAVGGQIASTGNGVDTVEIEGLLNRLEVRGGISASGKGSDAVSRKGNRFGFLSRIRWTL